mmetsp:Transcript_40630/g.117506  ORF Transcript_40630/g.117506 Transcript_40630/m.117506 type:complete len:266 (-) Transcript_40630:8-805(-)
MSRKTCAWPLRRSSSTSERRTTRETTRSQEQAAMDSAANTSLYNSEMPLHSSAVRPLARDKCLTAFGRTAMPRRTALQATACESSVILGATTSSKTWPPGVATTPRTSGAHIPASASAGPCQFAVPPPEPAATRRSSDATMSHTEAACLADAEKKPVTDTCGGKSPVESTSKPASLHNARLRRSACAKAEDSSGWSVHKYSSRGSSFSAQGAAMGPAAPDAAAVAEAGIGGGGIATSIWSGPGGPEIGQASHRKPSRPGVLPRTC